MCRSRNRYTARKSDFPSHQTLSYILRQHHMRECQKKKDAEKLRHVDPSLIITEKKKRAREETNSRSEQARRVKESREDGV